MLPLVLLYLALVAIFGVTGVFTWILRGRGFSDFRRSPKPTPPADAGPISGQPGSQVEIESR